MVKQEETNMDKNKPQPKAFRITEETAEKFKEIAQSLGGNQQQTLAKLIEVYEMETGKESLPEMKESIETFEGYVRAAANMYLQALETNQNMRALVRAEFESLLKSKDQTIEELQNRVKKAEERSQNATEKEQVLKKELTELELQKELLEKKVLEENTLYKERLEEEQHKYERLDKAYSKLQTSEEEGKAMLSSFMKECENRKEENTTLQEKLNLAETKLTETVSKNELLISKLQEEKRQVEAQLHHAEAELVKEKQLFEEAVKHAKETMEQEKKTKEIEWRLELQIQENQLKEQHKQELDALRKELDKYKELYYQTGQNK